MTYKDCIVTTFEYTVAGDEGFSNISGKQEVYDSEGGIAYDLSENLNLTSDGISAMLGEAEFWVENLSEYLEPLESGTLVKVVLRHSEKEEKGSVQVTATRGGKASIYPPQKVSTESIKDILNGMWYADQ